MRLPFLLSAYEKNGVLKLLWQLQKLIPTTDAQHRARCLCCCRAEEGVPYIYPVRLRCSKTVGSVGW